MKGLIKKSAIRRLKIIRGQLKGLIGMIDEGRYCIDIIVQASAVKQALAGFEDAIMENHLGTCVVRQMKKGKSATAIAEILKVYRLKGKI